MKHAKTKPEAADPLTWWRSRDPSSVTPVDSVRLWSRIQTACLDRGLDTSRLVHLAIEGHREDRDLIMSHLYLKALEGHSGAVVVVSNVLRRECALCAQLSGAWADRLLEVSRSNAPASRASISVAGVSV